MKKNNLDIFLIIASIIIYFLLFFFISNYITEGFNISFLKKNAWLFIILLSLLLALWLYNHNLHFLNNFAIFWCFYSIFWTIYARFFITIVGPYPINTNLNKLQVIFYLFVLSLISISLIIYIYAWLCSKGLTNANYLKKINEYMEKNFSKYFDQILFHILKIIFQGIYRFFPNFENILYKALKIIYKIKDLFLLDKKKYMLILYEIPLWVFTLCFFIDIYFNKHYYLICYTANLLILPLFYKFCLYLLWHLSISYIERYYYIEPLSFEETNIRMVFFKKDFNIYSITEMLETIKTTVYTGDYQKFLQIQKSKTYFFFKQDTGLSEKNTIDQQHDILNHIVTCTTILLHIDIVTEQKKKYKIYTIFRLLILFCCFGGILYKGI